MAEILLKMALNTTMHNRYIRSLIIIQTNFDLFQVMRSDIITTRLFQQWTKKLTSISHTIVLYNFMEDGGIGNVLMPT